MKIARYLVLGLMAAMLAGPGNVGCSCKDSGGSVADDLDLTWAPSNLPFGTVALGNTKTLTVTLRHNGTSGTIQLSNLFLEDLSEEFTFEPPADLSLAVGEEVVVKVTYTPLSATSSYGFLVIENNVASLGGVARIPVTANGQVGEILVNPNPIDFGQVDTGKDLMLDVTVTNTGSDSVVLNALSLRLDGSADFTIEAINLPDSKVMPYTLAPTESIGLVIKYAPTGGGNDTSTLVIEGDTQGTYAVWSFDVLGEEMGPLLVASPGQLDFQYVPLNSEKTLLLNVANTGNAELVIPKDGVSLWMNSDPNIVVKNPPTADVKIAPGASYDYTIGWTSVAVTEDDGKPIGQLMIASNDVSHSPMPIPVYGRPDAPILVVIPDAVDMSFGAMMTPVYRTVTMRNDGSATLNVVSLTIVDASDTAYGDEFAIVHGSTTAATIGAFGIPGSGSPGATNSDSVQIKFTNKAPKEKKGQCLTAKMRIVSNYAGHETVDVPISVCRSDAPVCNVAMVPAGVNFGTVPIGFPKELPVNIVNIGTGNCTFQNAKIQDCTSGLLGGATCSAPNFGGASSAIFKLSNLPPVTAGGITPGMTHTMTVRFNPPSATPLFGLLNQYSAVLGIQVKDVVLGTTIVLPKAPTSGTYLANVMGSSGIAKISVLPGELKFGVTTIGCFSKTYKVCVYNSGNAPLMVTDIRLVGCSPEFKVKNIPKLPMAVPNGAPKCIEAVYAPQDEGPDTCSMQIDATDTSSPTVAVKLSGSGTYDTHQTDEFTQVTGQEVDILWIIDDSGSMCEEQDRLNQSFSDFIAQANVWKNDFHLGGISVNVTDEAVIGRLNRGDKSITPRYMTKTNGGSFAKMTMYGCNGGSDSQEAGMQAAQTALSAPLATDTGVVCGNDSDCANDANICPDPATCAYKCVDGKCGGFNAGFLREGAQLEMVVLSDEEDQSSGGLPFYVDFFKNIKGWYNVDMMHFNAIVGIDGVPKGGSESACVSSDGGTADSGDRYLQVATETKGLAGSICESSYSKIMNEIGNLTFHPKLQFFLSRLADPATVTVKVNGTTCSAGWRYDAPSNSIIFDPAAACMPGPGDKVLIDYETLCLTS
jgi:hypothetical protein